MTVNYVAMRGLGMVDAFPAGDLGVLKALSTGGKKISRKKLLQKLSSGDRIEPMLLYACGIV